MSKRRRGSNAPTVFLPQELIAEILSFLNVKTIVRLRCLSKSWNALISHSNFVEKHLKNSSQNPHLTLVWNQSKLTTPLYPLAYNVLLYPMHRLLKNPCINVYRNDFHPLEQCWKVIGSCNGLVCLVECTWRPAPTKYCLRFLNPATGMRSKQLGYFSDSNPVYIGYKFTFGYDASTRTYKVVAVKRKNYGSRKTKVKVFNLRDCRWRYIKSFPVVPLEDDGEHLSGTVNWLAEDKSEQLVIVSLDLSTETYKQFLLPPGYDDVPFVQPVLSVLMDSLCFSHDSKKTEFVLWQMKEYGVQESWTIVFKINYQNLQKRLPMDINIDINSDYGFQLACLYKNGDTVIFSIKICTEFGSRQFPNHAIIYNLKDNTVEQINCNVRIQWFEKAKDYVESLVSVPWKESATATSKQCGRIIKGERKEEKHLISHDAEKLNNLGLGMIDETIS